MTTQGILWAVLQNPGPLAAITPRYEMVQCHHITLQYGVEREPWQLWIGQEFAAIATAECWNEQVQALRVLLPATIPCINLHPHLTVSHRVDVEPKTANHMLVTQHTVRSIWLVLPVRIEFHMKAP